MESPHAVQLQNETDQTVSTISAGHKILQVPKPIHFNNTDRSVVVNGDGSLYSIHTQSLLNRGDMLLQWDATGGPHYSHGALIEFQRRRPRTDAAMKKGSLELSLLGGLCADLIEWDPDDGALDVDEMFIPHDDVEAEQALNTLVELGLAVKKPHATGCLGQATAEAVRNSEPGVLLRNAVAMRSLVKSEAPLKMSVLELLTTLVKFKWKPDVVTQLAAQKKKPDARKGGQKIFDFRHSKLSLGKMYLRCLVMLEFGQIAGPVPHLVN